MSPAYHAGYAAGGGDGEKGGDRRQRASIDGEEFVSCSRSLKLDSSEGAVLVEKPIAMPDRAPFGTSEGTFAIVEGATIEDQARDEEGPEAAGKSARRLAYERDYVRRNLALLTESSQARSAVREKSSRTRDAAGPAGDGKAAILSAVPPGSYYIYSFDGKLMAEYDGAGQLVRDYIYIGNQLVAEYQGGTTYFYYASDQVNSTRAVTNGSGTVVYSVAYDPYGGVQKTWGTPTYTPALKFSGKERDVESGLDYFGARYFANFHYRWLSVDPVINRQEALGNPQLWNLYAFCRDNPITYWDPDGRTELTFDVKRGLLHVDPQTKGREPYSIPGTSGQGEGLNNPDMEGVKEVGPIPRGEWEIESKELNDPGIIKDVGRTIFKGDWGDWRIEIHPTKGTDTKGRKGIFMHGGLFKGSAGCIDVGGGIFGSKITNRLKADILTDPDGIVPVHVR